MIVRFFYEIFLRLYLAGVHIVALKNKKAEMWLDGRKTARDLQKLWHIKHCIWFHTSSLGEFEQVSYLIETIRKNYPEERILVTFFSPSGYEIKKNFPHADHITYLPFDIYKNSYDFINAIQPKIAFWIRYEFWLNTLEILKDKKVPIILLNGVFREHTPWFYSAYLKNCLRCFSEITVINKSSLKNIEKHGFSAKIIHDTRYSRMHQIAQTPFEDKKLNHFIGKDKVIVCGSIWPKDDIILKESIEMNGQIRWILVPHEVDPMRIEQLCTTFPNAQKYSQYNINKACSILIIDRIGLLAKIYRLAYVAYVGGGFNKVVHSLIEPLTYAIPILIGKNIEKSEEAKDFLHLSFVQQIHSKDDFKITLAEILNKENVELKRLKIEYVQQRANSVDKVLEILSSYLT